jgi:hypothetical protein
MSRDFDYAALADSLDKLRLSPIVSMDPGEYITNVALERLSRALRALAPEPVDPSALPIGRYGYQLRFPRGSLNPSLFGYMLDLGKWQLKQGLDRDGCTAVSVPRVEVKRGDFPTWFIDEETGEEVITPVMDALVFTVEMVQAEIPQPPLGHSRSRHDRSPVPLNWTA